MNFEKDFIPKPPPEVIFDRWGNPINPPSRPGTAISVKSPVDRRDNGFLTQKLIKSPKVLNDRNQPKLTEANVQVKNLRPRTAETRKPAGYNSVY